MDFVNGFPFLINMVDSFARFRVDVNHKYWENVSNEITQDDILWEYGSAILKPTELYTMNASSFCTLLRLTDFVYDNK